MPDIQVTFAHPGKPETMVQLDTTTAHTSQDINWYFASLSNNVHYAQIEFKDPTFKPFSNIDGYKATVELSFGSGTLTGTLPTPAEHGVVVQSYTVRGLNQNQEPIGDFTLDPDIVTVDP